MSHDEALVDEVAEAIFDVVVDHPMWLGSDGEPLDYNPDREARICDFAGDAARAVLDALDVPDLLRAAKAEALREAADDMERIFRAGNLLGGPTDDWLRLRAAEIDPEEGDDE